MHLTCMGKSPCHAWKKEAHLCGFEYQSTMQDSMATANAVIVLAACIAQSCTLKPRVQDFLPRNRTQTSPSALVCSTLLLKQT